MARVLAPATAMLLLPSGAAPQQFIEVLGQSVELPAATGPIRVEQRVECSRRSRWLRPLLLGQAALHGADAHSTRRVIRAGGAEANPLMRWATVSDRRAYGVKAAFMTGNWWLTERLSCRHPVAAVWMTVATNSFLTLVVARNYRIGNMLLAGP